MFKRLHALALAAATACALPAAAATVTVYSNNFDAPAVTAGGTTAVFSDAGGGLQATDPAYNATYGNVFRNSTTGETTLTLSNLPAHTSLSLGYLLAFLDSWDSINGTVTPDLLTFSIDGVVVGNYTYDNASGGITQIGGGKLVAAYTQFDVNYYYSDSIADMTGDPALTIAHTASSITFGWQVGGNGWQGGDDEAWGMDNLRVTVNTTAGSTVPEPASLALLALAAAGAGIARRRRRG
ncbi:MAG: PEP-CTERM sorting domain-containing protein [Proteobacteria bacterium]|nr:PEP-CTERM sorting domain-containing protein [Pseudomonadota bacterium]